MMAARLGGPRVLRRGLSEVARHRPVMNLESMYPMKQNNAWVAPNATVVGDVYLADEVSVWYRAVVRGDRNKVSFGAGSSVGDKAVVTTVETLESGFPAVCEIGEYVSIGAGSVLKSCTVGSKVDIGAGCVLCEGSLVEDKVALKPGTVVPAGGRIPSGQIWAGNPAEYVADLTEEQVHDIVKKSEDIHERAWECSLQYLPLPDAP